MADQPAYLSAVSLHLSRTLDEIGINSLTVERRRKTFLHNERFENAYLRLSDRDSSAYHFGSQTEGTTTRGLDSDSDTLVCQRSFNIIDDVSGWRQGEENLLMLHEDTAPGYCRLQLLQIDEPLPFEEPPHQHYTIDNSGRVILKNTGSHRPPPGMHGDMHGPAMSQSGRRGTVDTDTVIAFQCKTWPQQGAQFVRRHRRYGWPSRGLIREATKDGVFLVPVGYKLSPNELVEWRLSASLAERCLMFSLSIVHLKCYVVLKMLVKSFIDPIMTRCITSYHCKTAVLHCTENTEPGFWRDDNLLQCVTRCLTMILSWVDNMFCPHFIIQDDNLFAGKVTAQNRAVFYSVLTKLVNSNGRALLLVGIDELGWKLQERLNTLPSTTPVLNSPQTVKCVGTVEISKQAQIHVVLKWFGLGKREESIPTVQFIQQKMERLAVCIGQANRQERLSFQRLNQFLSGWLGSLLASVALSRRKRIPRKAIYLLYTGAKADISSMLKLASVFLCEGELQKAETTLKKLEDHFGRHVVRPICTCYDMACEFPMDFCQSVFALKTEKARDKLFANCVLVSRPELHWAPPALHHEFFSSLLDAGEQRDPTHQTPQGLAAVDCLPYLYYLQYLTYRKLGNKDRLLQRTLRNLDRCVREGKHFGHLQTAWNLLGQCMELEYMTENAKDCYRTSLGIRPRNNAAKRHLQNLH